MHLPIEFSISGSVPHDLLVDAMDSCFSCLVILYGLVNIADEDVEVFLVLGSDFVVCSLVLLEPGNYFLFVEVKGEWVCLECCPFCCSSYFEFRWDVVKFLESKSIKTEH